MKATVKLKVFSNPCGKVLLRPGNGLAHTFCELTRNRTLTEHDVQLIIGLGFEIEIVDEDADENI